MTTPSRGGISQQSGGMPGSGGGGGGGNSEWTVEFLQGKGPDGIGNFQDVIPIVIDFTKEYLAFTYVEVGVGAGVDTSFAEFQGGPGAIVEIGPFPENVAGFNSYVNSAWGGGGAGRMFEIQDANGNVFTKLNDLDDPNSLGGMFIVRPRDTASTPPPVGGTGPVCGYLSASGENGIQYDPQTPEFLWQYNGQADGDVALFGLLSRSE